MDTLGLWWGQVGLWALEALEALGRGGRRGWGGGIRDGSTAPEGGPVREGRRGQQGAVVVCVWSHWPLQSGRPCAARSLPMATTHRPSLTFFHPPGFWALPAASEKPSKVRQQGVQGRAERVHGFAARERALKLSQGCVDDTVGAEGKGEAPRELCVCVCVCVCV